MYAIIEDRGKQYKVTTGDMLLIDRQDLPDGQAEITFDKVLMLGEGTDARIGTPWLGGASVTAKVIGELKMAKVRGVKFARRKGYYKRWGHRQRMLRVQIDTINA